MSMPQLYLMNTSGDINPSTLQVKPDGASTLPGRVLAVFAGSGKIKDRRVPVHGCGERLMRASDVRREADISVTSRVQSDRSGESPELTPKIIPAQKRGPEKRV